MIAPEQLSSTYANYASQTADIPPPAILDPAAISAWVCAEVGPSAPQRGTSLSLLRRRLWCECLKFECAGGDIVTTGRAFTAFAEAALPLAFPATTCDQITFIALGHFGSRELGPACEADLACIVRDDAPGYAGIVRQGLACLMGGPDAPFSLRIYQTHQPHGRFSPVCDSPAFEHHLATHMSDHDRFIWLRALILSGDHDLQKDLITPFVYRRYHDYTVFESLREIYSRLRTEIRRDGLDANIRHGPGGLREIEFIVQAFQLIHGGRDSRLRHPSIAHILGEMQHRKELAAAPLAELTAAYHFLRRLEHALQYLDDQQNHTLPADPVHAECVARFMGFTAPADFAAALASHRGNVERQFEAIVGAADPADPDLPWPVSRPGTEEIRLLQVSGFTDPSGVHAALLATQEDPRHASLDHNQHRHFDRLMPAVLGSIAESATDKDATTTRRCIETLFAIASQPAYLALLGERPPAAARLARLCAASPWVADYLARHAWLTDELLSPETLLTIPAPQELAHALQLQLDKEAPTDSHRQLVLLNEFRQLHAFRIVARELLLGDAQGAGGWELSQLADTLLAEGLRRTWSSSLRRHRDEPAFAVIAYGKLGARELGHGSDLDLVFICQDDAPDAQENYQRLARRFTAWLGSTTEAGTLYEIDLRLRPDGDSGVLAVSFAAFEDYQWKRAWLWEHQALTRARFCVGDPAIGAAFEALRRQILARQRDPQKVAEEVLSMRERMRNEHAATADLFDLKQDHGGLVDVEFAVQFLVLAHASHCDGLLDDVGDRELLHRAGAAGLLPSSLAADTARAYERYRQLQQSMRLLGREKARVPRQEVAAEIASVQKLWQFIFAPTDTEP